MTEILLELGGLLEILVPSVDLPPEETLLYQSMEQVGVSAFSIAHRRAPNHNCVALEPPQYVVNYLLNCSAGDFPPAVRAMRKAYPSPEEAEVIHDLGDSGYGGAWVVAAVLLIDADGG